MRIKYLGEKVIFLEGKNESVLINSDDELIAKSKSRLVLYTDEEKGRADLEGDRVFINGTGEYEVGGVEVCGVSGEGGKTIYRLGIDGFKVVIVGELGQELNEKRIERIEGADALIVYLDTESLVDYKMSKELAKKWGANYLIPISTDNELLKKFLDEADNEGLEAIDFLRMEKVEDLPDGLETVLLKVTK